MTETTIRIRAGEIQIESTGDETSHAARMRDALAALRDCAPELLRGQDRAQAPAPTLRELLDRSVARSFGEKAGIVAYWLQRYRGREEWRSREIVDGLRDAGEVEPSNITEALNAEKRKGLFDVQDRMWRLTEKGEGWVEFALGVGQPA